LIDALPPVVIKAKRLFLREMSVQDAGELFKLYNDPDVLRYTNDVPFPSLSEAEAFVSTYGRYGQFGYGRWAVMHNESKEFMGWCGFKWDDELDVVTMGSRFHKKFWSNGIATEAAGACVDYAFNALDIDRIVSLAFRDNFASRRVLEKLGLQYVKELDYHGYDCVYMEIQRANVSQIYPGLNRIRHVA
jgi:[ribosomal protein S5]-alanine N-acetyltransferase